MLANIYSVITPFIIIMLLLEISYCLFFKKNYISFADAITNMATALGNQCVNIFVLHFVLWSYSYLHDWAPIKIPTNIGSFILLLIGFDFFFYWFHRWGHTINILWAAHMSHHTSEEMNLFVALRASITQRLFSFFFVWPLALMGFAPDAIYAASAVQLVIAFWHHTKVIGKMGWFEVYFNSPSHHRVHHGVNNPYLDKNFGEIFIIWDKWFGTFVEEKEEVVFGSLTPPQTCNPNKIYFQYWLHLLRDAYKTKFWWDKLRVWFMPLGWRPRDLRDQPRKLVWAHEQVKYVVEVSSALKIYLILQTVFGLFLMSFAINLKNHLLLSDRLIMTGVIWMMITSWGALLERKHYAPYLETFRLIVTFFVLNYLRSPYPELWLQLSVVVSIMLCWLTIYYPKRASIRNKI